MPNLLKMAKIQAILSLHAQGRSQRDIARTLNVDRATVQKYLLLGLSGAKPANAPTGSTGSKPATPGSGPKPANAPTGEATQQGPAEPPAGVSLGSPGPVSKCAPYRQVIESKAEEGLSAQRIYQDLAADGANVSYDSVRRFLRRLGRTRPLPFRRLEVAPGEEGQVDFGTGAPVIGADGKRRRTHVFRVVLSHSRKGYSEATFRQTTDDFLGALENAFRHFGGVPQTLVIDNLKAAVKHPDWFDPELTPKVQAFCQHYGVVILPTKPYMPRHKGKVEAGVKYVQNNALKARKFASLQEQNQHLADWERTIADTRIHGTTKRQVGKLFTEIERPALQPLTLEPFPNFQEAQRKVSRDGHVEVAKAYYSAPPEYLSRTVWVRWDARLVRIFNDRLEQIALHARHEQGRFSTDGNHIAPEKISGVERGAEILLDKVRVLGTETHEWAQAMLHARGIEGVRVLQGLLALAKKHPGQSLGKACQTALSHGEFRLRTLRKLIEREEPAQQPLPFIDAHPIIRPLDDYASVVAQAIHRRADRSSMSEGFRRHDWTKATAAKAHEKGSSEPLTASSSHAELLPPRPGYPSSGCPSAEPDSVSPDASIVVHDSATCRLPRGENDHA